MLYGPTLFNISGTLPSLPDYKHTYKTEEDPGFQGFHHVVYSRYPYTLTLPWQIRRERERALST